MKKQIGSRALIYWVCLLVIYLALAIGIPFRRNAVWSIALGCTIGMFAVCGISFLLAFRKEGIRSKLLGWPIFRVGYTFLGIQIVLGFLFMILAKQCPARYTIIAEVILYAVCGASLVVREASRTVTEQSITRLADRTAQWKRIRILADGIARTTGESRWKKLAEEIRYADPTEKPGDAEILRILDEGAGETAWEQVDRLIKLRKH